MIDVVHDFSRRLEQAIARYPRARGLHDARARLGAAMRPSQLREAAEIVQAALGLGHPLGRAMLASAVEFESARVASPVGRAPAATGGLRAPAATDALEPLNGWFDPGPRASSLLAGPGAPLAASVPGADAAPDPALLLPAAEPSSPLAVASGPSLGAPVAAVAPENPAITAAEPLAAEPLAAEPLAAEPLAAEPLVMEAELPAFAQGFPLPQAPEAVPADQLSPLQSDWPLATPDRPLGGLGRSGVLLMPELEEAPALPAPEPAAFGLAGRRSLGLEWEAAEAVPVRSAAPETVLDTHVRSRLSRLSAGAPSETRVPGSGVPALATPTSLGSTCPVPRPLPPRPRADEGGGASATVPPLDPVRAARRAAWQDRLDRMHHTLAEAVRAPVPPRATPRGSQVPGAETATG